MVDTGDLKSPAANTA